MEHAHKFHLSIDFLSASAIHSYLFDIEHAVILIWTVFLAVTRKLTSFLGARKGAHCSILFHFN